MQLLRDEQIEQFLGSGSVKHVPAATDTQTAIEMLLVCNNKIGILYVVPERKYLADSSVLESVKEGLERWKLQSLHR
jgi:hypothetical protein